MADVFISSATADREFVLQLASHLQSQGRTVAVPFDPAAMGENDPLSVPASECKLPPQISASASKLPSACRAIQRFIHGFLNVAIQYSTTRKNRLGESETEFVIHTSAPFACAVSRNSAPRTSSIGCSKLPRSATSRDAGRK